MKKEIIFLAILDIIAVFCLLLAYGTNKKFRDLLVTTAMHTKTHQYLAKILYNDNTIDEVLKQNYLEEPTEATDESQIVFVPKEEQVYDNIYEQQILERNKNDLYKLIEFKEKDFHVYLTVVYDASRITTVKSRFYGVRGEFLSTMAETNNAVIAVNGGGFKDVGGMGNGAEAHDIFISNGKIISDGRGLRHAVIGFNYNNVLTLNYLTAQEAIDRGIRDAVCFGPFLIVNGKASFTSGNGGYGANPRTGIAQRKDGIVLILTIDGNGSKYGYRGGATIIDMIDIFKRYGAYNAANLDGGASSVLAINGKTYNNPVAYDDSGERWLPNAWIVK